MFNEKLRAARKSVGLTQQQAAEALNLSTRSYQRYEAENGRTEPPLDTLKAIANLLNVSTDYLLTEEGEKMDEQKLKNIDEKIALAWLAGQDLSDCTPEEAKEKFFDAYHRIERTYPERWD